MGEVEEAADADLILHVVDAADEAKSDHIDTTLAVLEELDLAEIPRVLVFNKVELLSPIDRGILQKKYPDALLLSATSRESTRPLVARLAEELAERWDRSAKMPVAHPVERELAVEPCDEEMDRGGEVHASTLEELLRAAGRRSRATV